MKKIISLTLLILFATSCKLKEPKKIIIQKMTTETKNEPSITVVDTDFSKGR